MIKIGVIMELIFNFVFLVVGFVLLIKGADFFVEGAAGIADKFHIPQMIIGLTIVAFGTSAPEAAVSISAGLKGTAGIALGNILGSNIMNILIILGITCCICSLNVQKATVKFDMPFLILVSLVLLALCIIQGELNVISGVIFTVLFIIFFIQMIRTTKKERQLKVEKEEQEKITKKRNIWLLIVMTFGGLVAIVFGSDLTVDHATEIASAFGMSESLIGLTVIAFGTSLPELITSITAARKGNADIAIGNTIGSNIFNILFVLAITSFLTNIPIEVEFIIDGMIGLLSAIVLYLFSVKDKRLDRKNGIIMISGYVIYFVYLLIAR